MSENLRRRLTSAKEWLGPEKSHHSATFLGVSTLLRYKEKFLSIFPEAYFNKLENYNEDFPSDFDASKSHFVLKHSLLVPLATVANLHLQPGDKHFTIWLFVSAYLPVIAACIAPLGNLISFVALLEHWRVDLDTGFAIPDIYQTVVLNILAFAMGIVANLSLLMNFSAKLHYLVAQCLSIFCFSVASIFLLAAVLLTNATVHNSSSKVSEGFWLAVFTIVSYALCTMVLVTNVVGYKLDKYRAKFNLDKKQRSLMSHTIAFSIWQAVGTVVMAKLIPGLSFGTSLYYCTVSLLTIGLGDIVPITPGARVFALTFSLIGVLIMGLIISVLRQVILYSEGPSLFWHRLEKKRLKLLKTLEKEKQQQQQHQKEQEQEHQKEQKKEMGKFDTEDANSEIHKFRAFAEMRTLRSDIRRGQQRRSLLLTVLIFISFWLVGAVFFSEVEQWDYFEAIYFCGLCLLTIGYGDYHPVQPLGKTFFVVWAMAAVPLMTILISIMGDTLFELCDQVDYVVVKLFSPRTYKSLFKGKCYFSHRNKASSEKSVVLTNDKISEEISPNPSHIDISGYDQRFACQIRLTQDIANSFALLKKVMRDSMDSPKKEYDYSEWARHLRHFPSANSDEAQFWVGNLSPLRLPLHESNYILLKSIKKMEDNLERLMAQQNAAFNSNAGSITHESQATSTSEDNLFKC